MGETIVVAISICFITDSKKKMFYLHTRNILTVASAEPEKMATILRYLIHLLIDIF